MKKLLFICLLSVSMGVFSKSIGTVLFTVNKVETENRILTRGQPLYTGDTIITHAGASAQIKYFNGTLVTIHANSRYQTLAYAPNKKISLKTKLSPGAIEYVSSDRKKSTLRTPVVALAIEGTRFKAIATSRATYLDVSEGLVIGNGVKVGPEQAFSSGSFDEKGRFTPGSIPWNAVVNEESNMTNNMMDMDKMDTNTTMEVNEIMPKLVEDNAMNSIMETLAALTGIAQLEIIFP